MITARGACNGLVLAPRILMCRSKSSVQMILDHESSLDNLAAISSSDMKIEAEEPWERALNSLLVPTAIPSCPRAGMSKTTPK